MWIRTVCKSDNQAGAVYRRFLSRTFSHQTLSHTCLSPARLLILLWFTIRRSQTHKLACKRSTAGRTKELKNSEQILFRLNCRCVDNIIDLFNLKIFHAQRSITSCSIFLSLFIILFIQNNTSLLMDVVLDSAGSYPRLSLQSAYSAEPCQHLPSD